MGAFEEEGFYHDATQNWGDLKRLKELAEGVPVYLKGVCHIEVSLGSFQSWYAVPKERRW